MIGGVLGFYGPLPFYCSDSAVFNYKNLRSSKSVRWAEHPVYLKKPVKEFLGLDAVSVQFDIRFDSTYGVAPVLGLPLLEKLAEQHNSLPLTVGGSYFGMMVLEKYDVKHKFFGSGGACIVAEVSISLSEAGNGSLFS